MPVNTRERRRKRVCPEMQLHRIITQRTMEQQVPFKVTITEHNPERGVLANADVNVAGHYDHPQRKNQAG